MEIITGEGLKTLWEGFGPEGEHQGEEGSLLRDSLCLISLCVSFLSPFISSLFVSFPIHSIPLSSFSLRLICSLLRARGGVRIWVTLLQRSVRSHDHLELRVDIIPYARRLYSLPAKTQLNISLLALSLTALTRMSGSGLNRFSDIFLYTSVTGLSIRHVGERFQRANGTISKCAFKLLEMTIYKLIR